MYRFFPSLQWGSGYPDRQQIVSQITYLWKQYGLQNRTKFNTRVASVYKDKQGRWLINDPANGRFDGVVAAVGTCGEPKMPHLPNQEVFRGEICHSSQLDGKTAEGKKVLIIGGGASAVEALEFVVHTNAANTAVLSRSDKWIIPRNALVDMLLALNVFGEETVFSWIPEGLLRLFFYRDLKDLAPTKGLFTGTPMVNSDIFHQIRQGHAEWLRGDIIGFTEHGIRFNRRAPGVPKGGPGREEEVPGDMVIMATGFQRPSLSFLPEKVFQDPYQPPNWYLQVFPPEEVSCNPALAAPRPRCRTWLIGAGQHLRQQLHVRQRHRHRRQLPHRHLHAPAADVPGGSAGAPARGLDEALDRYDALAEVESAGRG